jgi:hypothetical protein
MFKIGEKVVIEDAGFQCRTYVEMAELMELDRWLNGNSLFDIDYQNEIFVVVAKSYGDDNNDLYYGIESYNGEQYIITKDGLRPLGTKKNYEGGYKFEYDKTLGCGMMVVFNKEKSVFGYNYKEDCPVVYPCDERKFIDPSLLFLKETKIFEHGKFYVDEADPTTPFMVMNGRHYFAVEDEFVVQKDFSGGGKRYEICYINEATKKGKEINK